MTKFVLQSDGIWFAMHLTAKTPLKALLKWLAVIASITSICIVLEHMHENITAHLLELDFPPLVQPENTSYP